MLLDVFRELLGLRSGRVVRCSLFLREYVDKVSRADLGALAAGLTLIVIDDRMIVLNVDSVEGTFLLALLTSDTSSYACVHGGFALIAGRAAYYDS